VIIGQAGEEPKTIVPVKPIVSFEFQPLNIVIGAAVAAGITFLLFRGECMAKYEKIKKALIRSKKSCRPRRKRQK
jgi:hypothetical protein